MAEKEGTSMKLSKGTLDKLKRVSSIMETTASNCIEQALEFYFAKSDIGKKCMTKILRNQKFVESLERGKIDDAKHYGSGKIISSTPLNNK